MAADNLTAQNQIREFNPDSTTHSSGEPVIECDPSLPGTTSKEGELQDPIVSSSESEAVYTSYTEEENIYITASEDEVNPSDPRLELIDKQFNLKMKELFSQASSGQLVSHTIEATLQQTAKDMLQYLGKSHPLTWISHIKTSQEDELLLWMTVMKDNVDVLMTQFQQQMFTGFSKMMSEMVKLYHK